MVLTTFNTLSVTSDEGKNDAAGTVENFEHLTVVFTDRAQRNLNIFQAL